MLRSKITGFESENLTSKSVVHVATHEDPLKGVDLISDRGFDTIRYVFRQSIDDVVLYIFVRDYDLLKKEY